MHTTSTQTSATAPMERRLARRQITVFAVVLSALSLTAVAFAVSRGADLNRIDDAPVAAQIALYGLAFMPGVAALVAWTAGGGRPRGFPWGFRRVPWTTIGLAWALPVLGTGLAYGTAWVTGAAGFDPGGLAAATGMPPPAVVLLGLVPGVLPYLVLALGEQLGWSCLLVTRLAAARGADATAFIVGLAWGVFHWPLIIFVPGGVGPGVPVPYALLWFTVETVAVAFPLVHLRLRTGGIWPVLVLHATLNASIYLVADAMTASGPYTAWLLGEGGALTSAALVLVIVATRRLWRARPCDTEVTP